MNHLTDQQLQELVSADKSGHSDLYSEWHNHIRECALCAEHYDTVLRFYSELEDRTTGEPLQKDYELAEKFLGKRRGFLLPQTAFQRRSTGFVQAYAEIAEPSRTAIERFTEYIRTNPVRSTAGFASFAAVLIFATTFFKPPKDLNPVVIQGAGMYLKALNRNGEELWQKEVDIMLRGSSESGFSRLTGDPFSSRFLLIDDVDGDGKNEVLLTGLADKSQKGLLFSPDSLYCFNYRGELLWSNGFPENVYADIFDFMRNEHWKVFDFVSFRQRNRPTRLFVAVQSIQYYPCKLLEVNILTGKILQTYWHSGGISNFCTTFFDVDGDGKEEIVTAGVNNGFRRAFISVLDPDDIGGMAPAPADFTPTRVPPAREKYYLLLPRSDISERFGRIPYTVITDMSRVDSNAIRVVSNEFVGGRGPLEGNIHYDIGRGMKFLSATWDDLFFKTYNSLLAEGKVHEPLSPAYWQRLMKQAQYWDGEKSRFVSYNELMRKSGMP